VHGDHAGEPSGRIVLTSFQRGSVAAERHIACDRQARKNLNLVSTALAALAPFLAEKLISIVQEEAEHREGEGEQCEDTQHNEAANLRPASSPTLADTASVKPGAGPISHRTPYPRGPPFGDKPTWVELERVVSLRQAAQLKGISVDTLKRRYAHLIINLSPRRRGMKLKHALGLE
jgi:hypothetical protein